MKAYEGADGPNKKAGHAVRSGRIVNLVAAQLMEKFQM